MRHEAQREFQRLAAALWRRARWKGRFDHMSSARKRSAIAKANKEADFLRQRLMRAEHHASVMQVFAEVAARRGDALYAAIQKHQAETRYAEASNTLALADRELYEAMKVSAGDTAPMGSNVE